MVDLPSIYYLKNSAHLVDFMKKSQADFLSFCHVVNLNDPQVQSVKQGVQGNLYNGLLYADYAELEKEVLRILKSAKRYKKYIFNLSHGIFPDVDVEKLRFIVRLVHEFQWNK